MAATPDPAAGERRPSWPVLLLMLAAIAASSMWALSLNRLLALRADVEALKSELCRRREEQQEAPGPRRRRGLSEPQTRVAQPCLQVMADSSKETFQKEFALETHTAIPWQTGLSRGRALEMDDNRILVREEGFYFLYSQVYYTESTFAMGHVVIRRKRNVVGDEPQHVILFRCIQNMNLEEAFNTCYTGGIVKLEVDDLLDLLIPRPTANVSLDGTSTFLGAVKLA